MNPFFTRFIPASLLLVFTQLSVIGQTDTLKTAHYDGLSLKDLLDVKIVSVSKKAEFLFDAALSASVVTREEIERAGCTSIMEALRLSPGIIVREQSNGNYDIHIRGLDNIPPNASFDMAGTTTLVMIDSRAIYSYLRGGTFWETLPVDIGDIDRIEVVRGPAAALYGPNAVNGVINIITRQTPKEGVHVDLTSQVGSNHTFIHNARVDYRSGKWSFGVSGNYQHRNRTQVSYYEFFRAQWFTDPDYLVNFQGDTARNIKERFPYQQLAMEKHGVNVFGNYKISKNIWFDLSAGHQSSIVQKVSAENEVTPLSTTMSDTRYIDVRGKIMGFTTQFSYLGGRQNIDYDPGNKFDFHTIDAGIEYNYTREHFTAKAGLNYRHTVYDDTKYSDLVAKRGIFNTKGSLSTLSPSLSFEYRMLENKLRFIGGISANKFTLPDTAYLSSQLAITYKLHKNHLVRVVHSNAPRSSNIFDTYVDQTIAYYPSGYQQFDRMGLYGNRDLKMFTASMFEVGYRGILSSRVNLDIEVFDVRGKNVNIMVTDEMFTRTEGPVTIREFPIRATNLPLRVHQQGVTFSLNYTSGRFQVKPFVTLQRTRLKHFAPYNTAPGVSNQNIYSGMGTTTKHEATPALFGGGSVNYTPGSKININVSSYFFTGQSYHHLSNVLFHDGVRGIDRISGKMIVNASISFEAIKNLHLFVNGKNLLNDRSREFFKADEVPCMILGGFKYNF
jgi:iron complex outermembrane receptor protein